MDTPVLEEMEQPLGAAIDLPSSVTFSRFLKQVNKNWPLLILEDYIDRTEGTFRSLFFILFVQEVSILQECSTTLWMIRATRRFCCFSKYVVKSDVLVIWQCFNHIHKHGLKMSFALSLRLCIQHSIRESETQTSSTQSNSKINHSSNISIYSSSVNFSNNDLGTYLKPNS